MNNKFKIQLEIKKSNGGFFHQNQKKPILNNSVKANKIIPNPINNYYTSSKMRLKNNESNSFDQKTNELFLGKERKSKQIAN